MNNRPLIAITTGGENHLPRMSEYYLQAIAGAGASAVFIGPDVSIIDSLTRFDGFIIPGGGDIDPLLYNEEQTADLDLEYERRVKSDLALFRSAVKQQMPVLGICYGMQLMNVALGGTLYQDIVPLQGEGIDHRGGIHQILVKDNPFVTAGRYEVNSSHHQAVKTTGMGLDAFAFAPDGIMEAFYSLRTSFLLGVQWHPERMTNELSRIIFRTFIEACCERK